MLTPSINKYHVITAMSGSLSIQQHGQEYDEGLDAIYHVYSKTST